MYKQLLGVQSGLCQSLQMSFTSTLFRMILVKNQYFLHCSGEKFNLNLKLIFWLYVPEGLRYRNMSSQIVGKFSQNSQDISQDFQLPSAYESAMEALSTLITQKKRNGIPAISGQNQKLDRMLRYIKVVPFLPQTVSPLRVA